MAASRIPTIPTATAGAPRDKAYAPNVAEKIPRATVEAMPLNTQTQPPASEVPSSRFHSPQCFSPGPSQPSSPHRQL